MLYFFMIKNILLSTMLMVSTPLNTIITNTVSRTVYLTNTSQWLIDEGQDFIYSYRNKTTTAINTDSFTMKQRTIEKYANDETDGVAGNEIYYLGNIKATNIETINNVVIETTGVVNPQWFSQGEIYIYKLENEDIETNATIENFLNGSTITTVSQYEAIILEIENLFTTPTNYEVLDNQNYYSKTINIDIPTIMTENPCNYFTFLLKVNIGMGTNYNEYPLTEPYSPFTQYIQESKTTMEFSANINPGGTGEIVDIPGLLFSIIGMPFTFLSQAFNLTIFPGTVYAINISHIFLAVIGAGILIFVIKKVLK